MSKTDSAHLIAGHLKTVFASLRDPDISIRRRALDLVYAMCDRESAKPILAELLDYVETADLLIREELVLKTAILAERFSTNYKDYVDVIVKLIALAGDFVGDDIWFRVIKIITNHEEIQEYSASVVFNALNQDTWHEAMIKVGGYVLGEFGHLIAEKQGSDPQNQFRVLYQRFGMVSAPTKALLLSSFCKFVNVWPELRRTCREVFTTHANFIDAEIQQRAVEYLKLTLPNEEDLLGTVMDSIPPWEGTDKPLGGEAMEPGRPAGPTAAKYAAVAAQKTSPAADLLGLGGLGGDSSAASGSGSTTKPAPASNPIDDLLGLGSATSSASTPATTTAPKV